MSTPRRGRVQNSSNRVATSATPWRSVLEKETDLSCKYPWDPSRIPSIVSAGLQMRAPMEARLRAAHTLRKAMECATEAQRVEAMRMPMVGGAIHYFLDHVADEANPASCARLQEHALMTLVYCLGNDARLDEELILDDGTIQRMHGCLVSRYVVVVAAAAQLVRRISELDHIRSVLAFDESLYHDILLLLETVEDPRVRTHILSTLINMAAHPKLQFMMARSARLVQWLVEAVFQYCAHLSEPSLSTLGDHASRTASSLRGPSYASRGISSQGQSPSPHVAASVDRSVSQAEGADTAVKCVRVLANLLSYAPNRSEVQRRVPSILEAMLNCQHPRAPTDLVEASRCVVHLFHENPVDLQFELSSELVQRAQTS
jgi:hypothetical protein